MPKTAADVMVRSVLTLSPDATLLDAQRLFVEEEIHGAPVVDDDGIVLGVVTTSDVLRDVVEEQETAGVSSDYLREVLEFGPPAWSGPEDFRDRLSGRRVSEVMTEGAYTVEEDASVREVAELLRREGVHRVWVVKEGRPTGVISTFDLLPLVRD